VSTYAITFLRVGAIAGWLLTVIAGCSSTSSDPPPTVTLDLDTSCADRAAWGANGSPDCSACLAKVQIACDCSHIGYEGKCEAVSIAKAKEPDCSAALDQCVAGCGGDCRCASACYAGHDACRARATELNSCMVQACDAYCR